MGRGAGVEEREVVNLAAEEDGAGAARRALPMMTPVKVLLAEGDDSTRHVISALLRKCGYHVSAASDGVKAWEILKEKSFKIDLVLTEVELPLMSGFLLLSTIMEHDACKNIPVIMMSSNDAVSMVFKANCTQHRIPGPLPGGPVATLAGQLSWEPHCPVQLSSTAGSRAAMLTASTARAMSARVRGREDAGHGVQHAKTLKRRRYGVRSPEPGMAAMATRWPCTELRKTRPWRGYEHQSKGERGPEGSPAHPRCVRVLGAEGDGRSWPESTTELGFGVSAEELERESAREREESEGEGR